MKEIELKFQVPDSALSGVHEALRALGHAPPITMHAAYFDTADDALARQRCAWRVRREGDDWVQTYKGLGADAMTRVEENCALNAPADGRPAPDLTAHSPAVQLALRRALSASDHSDAPLPTLVTVYDTRFERHVRTLDHALGRVAVCLDLGAIEAGSARERLQELEFELLDGQPQALLSLAMGWVQAHGLWLDVQSKAMKGTRLAALAQTAPAAAGPLARPCVPVALPTLVQTPRAHLSELLDTCAGNWAELATPREGWADALALWQRAHPLVNQAMAGTALGNSPQWRALDEALQSALTEPDTAERAAELATSAAPTGWALAVLSHLQTLN
jgi:hypothetical protein